MKFSYFVLILSFFSFSLFVLAEPLNKQDLLEKTERKEAQQVLKESRVSERLNVLNDKNIDRERLQVRGPKTCENTLQMMENRLDVLESNLKKRRSLVEKISLIINKKVTYLKSKGMDTSAIEVSLQEYLNSSNELLKQREGSMMVLSDLTRFDCAGDPSNFKNNLKDFNLRFRNHNLEFNKLHNEFKKNILYQISTLSEKLQNSMDTTEEESKDE